LTSRAIAGLIDDAAERLKRSQNPRLDAELLFRGTSGLTRAGLLSRAEEPVSPELAARFETAVARRERRESIQYILGRAAFWRDEFTVNRAVLIPRPETEILVEAVAARLRRHEAPSLLELGTGSGCIVLSLLRELPSARAVAVDISEPALSVARENANRLGFEPRIEFRVSRWFDAVGATEPFDAIVSNPPYVARADEADLPHEVREFEPGLALFAEASDVLSSYRAILGGIEGRLKPGGLLALEVGMGQAEAVAALAAQAGFGSREILNDLAATPRVVVGRRA
jgi:release factor glutamine methyltransferase